MNTLKYHKRYNAQKEQEAWEQRQKEEEEKLAQMTPEERKAYLEARDKKLRDALSFLTLPEALGIKRYY